MFVITLKAIILSQLRRLFVPLPHSTPATAAMCQRRTRIKAFFTRLRSEVHYTTPILPVTFLFPFCVHDNAVENGNGGPLGKKITQPSTE